MTKTTKRETIEEFDQNGKIIKRTITEETTEDDTVYSNTPSYPFQNGWNYRGTDIHLQNEQPSSCSNKGNHKRRALWFCFICWE